MYKLKNATLRIVSLRKMSSNIEKYWFGICVSGKKNNKNKLETQGISINREMVDSAAVHFSYGILYKN